MKETQNNERPTRAVKTGLTAAGSRATRALKESPGGLAALVSRAGMLLLHARGAPFAGLGEIVGTRRAGRATAAVEVGAGSTEVAPSVPVSVLHVSQPTDGGVARHVADLALEHHARGGRVGVACPEWGRLAEVLRSGGVGVEPLVLLRNPSPREDLAAFVALLRVLRRGGYDVVHCHSAKAGVVARAAALIAGVPAVYTPHAWSFLAAGSGIERLAYRTIEFVLARVATRKVLCVSKEEMELGRRAVGIPREKLRVVPNGVRVPPWVVGAVEARRSRALGPAPEAPPRRRVTRCERVGRGAGGGGA